MRVSEATRVEPHNGKHVIIMRNFSITLYAANVFHTPAGSALRCACQHNELRYGKEYMHDTPIIANKSKMYLHPKN